jgi:hypothetical protein
VKFVVDLITTAVNDLLEALLGLDEASC